MPAWALWGTLLLGATPFSESSVVDEAARAGWVTDRTVQFGSKEQPWVLALERRAENPSRFRVRRAERDGRKWSVSASTEPVAGSRIGVFRKVRFGGRPGLVWSIESDAPDEVVHRVLAFVDPGRGPLRAELDRRFIVPESAEEASARSFGNGRRRWFLQTDADGEAEIVHVTKPRRLNVPGREGQTHAYVVGVETTVHRWRHGRFRSDPKGRDFLPPHPVEEVEANQQLPQIWGTAQPFWAADGRLDTAWAVDPKLEGKPELTVRFDGVRKVAVIRLVPGCAQTPEAWSNHRRIEVIDLDLGGTASFTLDLDGPPPPGVEALGRFPLSSRFGEQVFVVLERPRQVRWAKLRPLETEGEGDGDRLCLSELSFH
jgi:hypothetical protein